MSMIGSMQQPQAVRELEFHAGTRRKEEAKFSVRTVFWILASGACYYVATQIAWVLCFPDSKVSLFFPPRAVLISILLLVPTRHWWAYTLAAACSHFFATQQAEWPPSGGTTAGSARSPPGFASGTARVRASFPRSPRW